MTTQTQALSIEDTLKLALEVMRNNGDVSVDEWIATEKAIKEALSTKCVAQPEQEPVTPFGLPLFWNAPAPRPDGSLINEGTKKPEQEPVAWRAWFDADNSAKWLFTLWPEEEHPSFDWQPLYTTPPQRKPLTDEEIMTYRHMIDWTADWSYIEFARAIEAKLKEKNNA